MAPNAVEEAAERLTERLAEAEVFVRTNPPWSAADLEMHVTLVDQRDDGHVVETFVVELVDQGSRRVGAFSHIESPAK